MADITDLGAMRALAHPFADPDARGTRHPGRGDRHRTFRFGERESVELFLPPAEAGRVRLHREIAEALQAAVAPYLDRLADPGLRPEGAGLVRLFAATTYVAEYQERIDRDSAERGAATATATATEHDA